MSEAQVNTVEKPSISARPLRKRKLVDYADNLSETETESEQEDGKEDSFSQRKSKKRQKPATRKRSPKIKPFPFLQLPAEIRNTIYEHVFTGPQGIDIAVRTRTNRQIPRAVFLLENGDVCYPCDIQRRCLKDKVDECDLHQSMPTELLLANRQIYNEARTILYEQPFHFSDEKDMYYFLATIGHTNRILLKRLELDGLSHSRGLKCYAHPAFTLLADATCLVDFALGNLRYGNSPRRIYSTTYFWLSSLLARGSVWDVLRFKENQVFTGVAYRDDQKGPLMNMIDRFLTTGGSSASDDEEAEEEDEA